MKRLIAFALALAVVFGASLALYRPELKDAAQETAADEWVGYFFALEPFSGRHYAAENGDDYDFGVPGVPVFVTITAFQPGEPGYSDNEAYNYSVGQAVSGEVDGGGMRVYVDDDGDRYEIGGDIILDAQNRAVLNECYVYRTAEGKYYVECVTVNGMKSAYCGPGFGLKQTRSAEWTVNGKKRSRSISVSVSLVEYAAVEAVTLAWMDGEKNILLRTEYPADALPETLTAPENAVLLVAALRNADGTVTRGAYTADGEARSVRLYVPSEMEGLLRRCDIPLDWGEDGG